MRGEIHKKLQLLALGWLKRQKCNYFTSEVRFGLYIWDAIGLKNYGESFGIEIKAGSNDLDKARQAKITKQSGIVFDYYYLLIPDYLGVPETKIWPHWGVLHVTSNDNIICVRKAEKMKKEKVLHLDLKRTIREKKHQQKLLKNRARYSL